MKINVNKGTISASLLFASIFYSIYYAIQTNQWYLFLISLGLGLTHQLIGHSIALHRLFSHRSFKTDRWKEIFLTYYCILCGVGSPRTWSMTHRLHHLNSDKDNDPHSPNISGFWTVVTNFIVFKTNTKHRLEDPIRRKTPIDQDLVTDPHQQIVHQHYYTIWLSLIVIVFAIGGLPSVVFGLMLPSYYSWFCGGLSNALGHWKSHGYRNFNLPDSSTNSWLVNIFVPGDGYQNNHHRYSNSPNFAVKSNEHDLIWNIIQLFFIKKTK